MISERTKRIYGVITFITVAFILDVVTGNLVHSSADTWEDAYWLANDFCKYRSWFESGLVVAILPLFTAYAIKYRPKFDVFDVAMFALWCLSFLMTNFDYAANKNLREVDMDMQAFAVIALIIWILKIWNRK